VAADDLEIATVLQQLGQPLMDLRTGQAAEALLDLVLQLAARAADHAAVHVEHRLGPAPPGRIAGIEIPRLDAVLGDADAHQVAGKHKGSLVRAPNRTTA